MAKSKYAQYILTDLHTPEQMDLEMIKKLEEWNHLILWIDDKVVPGSFQMNCCWYVKVPDNQPYFQHKHDVPEIIGLFGSDHQNPHDMGGEVEFWMEDEKFMINKSCMIFVPAGVKHCPLYLKRVDRPIFHFTVVTSPLYSMST
jgi:hypothetical protein